MKKSIILEGANGSGKSTLGKALSLALGIPYIHAGGDPGNMKQALIASIDQYNKLNSGVILDRVTPISRVIYGNAAAIELPTLGTFCHVYCDLATIIYCTGEGEFTNKPYYPPGHFENITKHAKYIRGGYDKVFSGVPNIPYNFHTDTIDTIIEKLRGLEQ